VRANAVLTQPYGVPEWLPSVLLELSQHTNDPDPIKKTVQELFSEFRRTHQVHIR